MQAIEAEKGNFSYRTMQSDTWEGMKKTEKSPLEIHRSSSWKHDLLMKAKISEQNFRAKQDICTTSKQLPKILIKCLWWFYVHRFFDTLLSSMWSLITLPLPGGWTKNRTRRRRRHGDGAQTSLTSPGPGDRADRADGTSNQWCGGHELLLRWDGKSTSLGLFPQIHNLSLLVRKPETNPNCELVYKTANQRALSVRSRTTREDEETAAGWRRLRRRDK